MQCAKCEYMKIVQGKDKPIQVSSCGTQIQALLSTPFYHNEPYITTSYLFSCTTNPGYFCLESISTTALVSAYISSLAFIKLHELFTVNY